MTSNGIKQLISKLMTYYPRTYAPGMSQDRAAALFEDFSKSFEKHKDETVLEAAHNWHLHNSNACTVADLVGEIYNMTPITQEEFDRPSSWKDYFEDSEGYGYATNCATHEIDCIWKPNWKRERILKVDGREVILPAKMKSRVLKEHGIVWDNI